MEENVVKNICGGLGETLNKLFFHEIVHVLKFLIQDLTCCKIFVSKSDTI